MDSPTRKLQRSYTVAQKLEVIEWAKDNGRNISKTSKEWGIDRKRARERLKDEDIVANFAPEDKRRRRSVNLIKCFTLFIY